MTTKNKMLQAAAGNAGSGAGPNNDYWISFLGKNGFGGNIEVGKAVTTDSSGNIIICGNYDAYGSEPYNLLIAKFDSSGTLLWDKSLGGTGLENGYGVTVDSADNIIVCGQTASDGAGGTDLLVAKLDSSGTLLWSRALGGTDTDQAYSVAVDSTDNIIVAGRTNSDGAGNYDLLTAKYNSSGTLLWDKTLGGSGSDYGYGIGIDSADNIIITGLCNSDGAGGSDSLIAKYNSSGTLLWDKTLGGSVLDYSNGVGIDSADNIIIAGISASDGVGGNDILIAKYNSSGTLQWGKTLGGTMNDQGNGVGIDSADNIIIAGATSGDAAGGWGVLVAKYNSSGTLLWDKTLGSTTNEFGWGVAVDSANNIIVTGNDANNDALIAKLSPDGSGDGTYNGFVYQDAFLTSANAVLTDSNAVLTDSSAVLTSTNTSLTSDEVVLPYELFPITI
jgi:uncharacterized delta-60 repeat protein